VEKTMSKKQWLRKIEEIKEFEQMLADDGTIFLKFWLHIDQKEQWRRMKKLLSDPATAWRVGNQERREHKKYEEYVEITEQMIAQTNAEHAPWAIIAATDRRWTNVQVFEMIIERLEPYVAASEAPLPDAIVERLRAIGSKDGHTLVAPANQESELQTNSSVT
jgi:polyphosphate kinase 2 (PPK2 family)